MVKIRLTKLGRHKLPAYRVVAIDSRKRRDGAYLALLGTYEPASGKANLNEALILDLLKMGAQPSETVLSMLKKQGIYAKFLASKVKPEKKPVKKQARKSAKKVAKKAARKAAKKPAAKTEVKEAK